MAEPPVTLLSPATLDEMLMLASGTPPGCFVEVGVYKGGSAWHLARLAREQCRLLHLFDTFTGIPYQDPEDREHAVGDFGDTTLESVRQVIPDAVFHLGVFPATMPEESIEPIAFVHIDCDQYRGVKAAIERLYPMLVLGGVMLFDDYECTSGCTKAVDEAAGFGIRRTGQGKAFFLKEKPGA